MAAPSLPVIINPASGPDQPVLKLINRGFQTAGAAWHLQLTQRAGDAARLARDLHAAGAPVIAVCGGDGTVKEVAAALAGTAQPFAILPGGTGNALARELGIPLDLAAAAALAGDAFQNGQRHVVRAVDAGRLNDQVFVLRASLGLETELLRSTDRQLKDQLGQLAYPLTAIQRLGAVPFTRYRIQVDGQAVEAVGVQCTIANSAQMGVSGLALAQGADVSDGLLDVIVLSHVDWDALAEIAASHFFGEDTGVIVQHWQGRVITVTADPPQAVAFGGEIVAQTPVTATILPGALRIVCPAL